METDIKVFIDGFKNKTGIDLAVYSVDGKMIEGQAHFPLQVLTDFDDLYQDEENDITLFFINYKTQKFIGCIQGVTEVEKNYALLIAELAKNSNFREVELTRSEFCKAILLGEVSYSQVVRYQKKYDMQDAPAFVLIVCADNRHNEIINVLKNYTKD